jgi:excisionase family DNA binding protein
METKLLTIKDAERELTVGHSTMQRLLDSGQLKSLHIGRRRVVRQVDLNEFIIEQLVEAGFDRNDLQDGGA